MKEETNDPAMVFGTRAVLEALHSGKEFERLFIQQGLNNPLIRELKEELRRTGLLYLSVPVEKLNRLTRHNHQGVVAFLADISYHQVEDLVPSLFEAGKIPLLLILDRITDTRNLGAIARTAECAGVHALIVPSRGSALISGEAFKASSGALHHIPVCKEDNLKNTIDYLKDSGIKVVSCTEKAAGFSYDADLKGPIAIILGNEENGVSQEYLKRSDSRVRLPMAGEVSSYNVSVAAGMVLYEVMSQRNK